MTHFKNIPDMLLKRIYVLAEQIVRLEQELVHIQEQCPERTSCYLRFLPRISATYGYAPGPPNRGSVRAHDGKVEYDGIEEWQIVLADWYGEEATTIIRKRDDLLKQKYRLNSRYLKVTGDPFVPRFVVRVRAIGLEKDI